MGGLHGYRYAAIATDKATRKRFIFFLRHKNELKDKVNELRLKIELLGGWTNPMIWLYRHNGPKGSAKAELHLGQNAKAMN